MIILSVLLQNYSLTLPFLLSKDTNNEAYVDVDHNLESVLQQHDFIKVHTYSQVKVYAYQSPIDKSIDCCIALVFLHHPVHLALESRPPWISTSFGLKRWKTQSQAAESFHWLQTLNLTFLGVMDDFVTPKDVSGTILTPFALRVYVSKRLHVGDLRVGTLLAKALLLGRNSSHVLDKSLMRRKALNTFCRKYGEERTYTAHSFLDRLIFFISASSNDQDTIVNEVYDRMQRQNNNERTGFDDHLKKLREEYFSDQNQPFINALTAKRDSGTIQSQRERGEKRKSGFVDALARYH